MAISVTCPNCNSTFQVADRFAGTTGPCPRCKTPLTVEGPMTTATAPQVIDLIDHKTLLVLFREYVDRCIEKTNFSKPLRPMSFDEWYNRAYLPNIDDLTQVVAFSESHEQAAGGHLVGPTAWKLVHARIPANILTETGGIVDDLSLRQFAQALARKMNERLPTILYDGKVVYKWSWD